ncbi:hypothetical protein XENOCAPTIV_010946 [Xenoophorus captivus]|uniref:B30.2/SPRY domain-containing protein n=1 Tax=Xenoophorus captivus TaxID=1517983 RepID=A0ABV0QZZ8_9TELE
MFKNSESEDSVDFSFLCLHIGFTNSVVSCSYHGNHNEYFLEKVEFCVTCFQSEFSVPRAPEIDVPGCTVRDNSITVAWQQINDADENGPIERYELEYRKTNHNSSVRASGDACWERICNITDTQVTISGEMLQNGPFRCDVTQFYCLATQFPISGLKFDSLFIIVRVRARNKAAAGDFSEPVAMETRGDQEINGGCHYWEIRLLADWKSHSVGVAYRGSLGRFDQLGKSISSWCLYASQWLQSSLAAKHNNRAKALDWPLPQRIGIYCDYDNGLINLFLFS